MVNAKQLYFAAAWIMLVVCVGSVKSSESVSNEANKVQAETNYTDIDEANLNLNDLMKQLIDSNVPLQSNENRVKQEYAKAQTLKKLIEDLGEYWSAGYRPIFGGIAEHWNDVDSLSAFLQVNPRVIRIIEAGRRDPDKVGYVVAAELERRIKRLPEVWLRYCEDTADNPDHSLGFAVSSDGDVIGSDSFRQWSKYCYSIPAAMWILYNIHYNKGIDSIWVFGTLMEHPDRHFISPKMPGWNMDMFEQLCPEMTIYIVDSFLQDNDGPAYNKEREAFRAIIGDLKLSEGTKRIKSSYALYPAGYAAGEVSGTGMSLESSIDVDVPDGYVLKRKLSESDITSLMKVLSQKSKKMGTVRSELDQNKTSTETLQIKSISDPVTIKAYFDKMQVGMDRETVRQITGKDGTTKVNNPESEQTYFYDYDNSYITIVYKVDSEDNTFSVLYKYHTIDNLTVKNRTEERFEAFNEWVRQRRGIMEGIQE